MFTSNIKIYSVECLIGVYECHCLLQVNGQLTVGENMADNGGIKSAYDAYVEWRRQHDDVYDSRTRPGLNLDSMRLFFLGFAQVMYPVMN